MTLYRQLLIFTLALCFMLFVGVWVDKLQSTRKFLVDQMATHAQDTATSLGLSLSPFLARHDTAAMETMLNAIFDRGYYRIIRLDDVAGNPIAKRILKIRVETVPEWFIGLIPLTAPGGTAQLMNGWKQAGTIYVESHPGYAYRTMWETAVQVTIYFFATGLVVLAAGGLGLRLLLRPLKRVEEQAEGICRRQYQLQKTIPRTRELRRVVESMNRLTTKVQEMFEEQANIAAGLRKQAYGDPLTGAGNRRYLMAQLLASMERGTRLSDCFCMVRINQLDRVNSELGYHAGDELLKHSGRILQQTASELHPENVVSRLGGADFGILFTDLTRENGETAARTISERLNRMPMTDLGVEGPAGNLGCLHYHQPLESTVILGEADALLQQAAADGAGGYRFRVYETGDRKTGGRSWWRGKLLEALETSAITLYSQPVRTGNQGSSRILHTEIYSRLVLPDGCAVQAGVFMPIAEREGLATSLDRLILSTILEKSSQLKNMVAVNLSVSSLYDDSFLSWFSGVFEEPERQDTQLLFEFHEFGAVHQLAKLTEFSRLARRFGHDIGIDHFGKSFSHFGYLKSLRPKYVKIDPGFTKELQTDQGDSVFFIDSLGAVAHSLDIEVIAGGVETDRELEILRSMNIDGVQGYAVERPIQL